MILSLVLVGNYINSPNLAAQQGVAKPMERPMGFIQHPDKKPGELIPTYNRFSSRKMTPEKVPESWEIALNIMKENRKKQQQELAAVMSRSRSVTPVRSLQFTESQAEGRVLGAIASLKTSSPATPITIKRRSVYNCSRSPDSLKTYDFSPSERMSPASRTLCPSPVSQPGVKTTSFSTSTPVAVTAGREDEVDRRPSTATTVVAHNEPHPKLDDTPQFTHSIVVAIDFGTTYSGYAYSFTHDPENVHIMRKWEGDDPGMNNQKTPTILLLSPDLHFHSFGITARDCYNDLDYKEARKWFYFDKFKMILHHNQVLRTTLCQFQPF